MPNSPQPETKPQITCGDQRPTLTKSHLLNLCAAGLLTFFFFPWIRILFGRFSGFDLAKDGGIYLVVWAIPLFCVITVLAGVTGQQSQKSIAVFTGALPFALLALGLYDKGKDLIQVLDAGAYVSLALGLLLILLPSNLKHVQ